MEEKETTLENLVEEIIDETEEETDVDLSDLLEESDEEDDDASFDDSENYEGFIPQTTDLNGELNFDRATLDEYLKNTYSFKEVQQQTFEEFKKKELEKEEIQSILELYDKGYKLKGFETFDSFIEYKKANHIFFITVGLPFEKILFDIEPKLFICRSFTSADYLKMLKEAPEAEIDFGVFNRYLISNCVLFPEIPNNEVDNLELGIQDILIPALMKHSRLNSNYDVRRL